MLKNIETHEKVTVMDVVEMPADIAAEVLTCYCNKNNRQCVLCGVVDGEETCPFEDSHCAKVTIDMWKKILKEMKVNA